MSDFCLSSVLNCRGLKNKRYSLLVCLIPRIARMSYTSNIPHNDIGRYVGLHIRLDWEVAGPPLAVGKFKTAWRFMGCS